MTTFSLRLTLSLSLAATTLAGCGGNPALQNVPAPDPAIMAGLAAGVAGAATLADPDAAARNQEQRKKDEEQRPVKSKANVPVDVLDRLDSPPAATTPPTTEAATPAETPALESRIPLKH